MIEAYKVSDGDTHHWVECQATTSLKSSEWLTTHKSLEAQGYYQGQRELWLPKPQFTTYKVPSTVQRISTNCNRNLNKVWSKHKSKNRKDNMQKRVPLMSSTTIWVPKPRLQAQGYYEGFTQIWIPKHVHTTPIQAKGAIPSTRRKQDV